MRAALVVLIALFSLSPPARADFQWNGTPDAPTARQLTYGAFLGSRLFMHYNFKDEAISTPPGGMLWEVQARLTYKQKYIGYLTGASSLSGGKNSLFGAGAMYPFFTFRNQGQGFFQKITGYLVLDLVYASLENPIPPKVYEDTAFALRFGGVLRFTFSGGIAVEAHGMVTQVVSNFFLAPMIGVRIPIGPQI